MEWNEASRSRGSGSQVLELTRKEKKKHGRARDVLYLKTMAFCLFVLCRCTFARIKLWRTSRESKQPRPWVREGGREGGSVECTAGVHCRQCSRNSQDAPGWDSGERRWKQESVCVREQQCIQWRMLGVQGSWLARMEGWRAAKGSNGPHATVKIICTHRHVYKCRLNGRRNIQTLVCIFPHKIQTLFQFSSIKLF